MVHRPTGTAVSEKAIKEVPAVVSELLGAEPKAEDWIPVNPTGELCDIYSRPSRVK